jgi:hypothetical protein
MAMRDDVWSTKSLVSIVYGAPSHLRDEMPSIKLLNQILADLEATSKQAAADVLR